jgi:CRISPR-associated protein Cas6/Cse3/CasE subtype I-E
MEQVTFPYPVKPDATTLHGVVEGLMRNRASNHYVFATEDAGPWVAITIRADSLPEALRVSAQPVGTYDVGSELDFTLTATAEKKAGGARKPLPSGDLAARLKWLEHRAGLHGFEVLEATAAQLTPMFIRKGFGERSFALDRTRFTGALRVVDQQKFSDALRNGVGRGRAYGNGLLFVRPRAA